MSAWQAEPVDLHAIAQLPYTYPEVGATAGPMPPGYKHIGFSAHIGLGQLRFEQGADAVIHLGMERGAGLGVQASSDVVTVGTVVVVKIGGCLKAPCRVVYVVDE